MAAIPVFCSSPQLLDLCVLDVGCLEFSYGVLAASALYHFSSSELMQRVSGRSALRGLHKVHKTWEPIVGLRVSLRLPSLQGTSGAT